MMSYFNEEELKELKLEEKLKKHPLPWSVEYKSPRAKRRRSPYEDSPPSFYLIRSATGQTVTQVWDPQDAHELLKLVNPHCGSCKSWAYNSHGPSWCDNPKGNGHVECNDTACDHYENGGDFPDWEKEFKEREWDE